MGIYHITSSLLVFCVFLLDVKAQEMLSKREIKIPLLSAVSVDRYTHLYLADRQGNIFKYDSLLELQGVFSSERPAAVMLMEAWQSVQVLVFSKDMQEFRLVNRFLSSATAYRFDNEAIGFVSLATIATDGTIWLFDQQDLSLKKYHYALNQLLLSSPLMFLLPAGGTELIFMREYENRLFISSKKSGIFVFDLFGNHLETLSIKAQNFGFQGDNMYWLEEKQLKIFHLYQREEKVIFEFEQKPDFVLLVGKNIFVVFGEKLQKYFLKNEY